MIGSVLDKYRILEKIGEGGMASVYRGEHVTLGREVAIKILHPHLSNQARSRQRFAREARAIENLHHDNILRIEDYSGESAPDCYIVTEFVDGETLQQLLADHGALPSEVVALIGLHLADALAYAHDIKIIHRDLKPENVMIKKDGTVKLMDFGIARFLDEMHLTMTGALVGSPAYMSPEQAMERVLDSRSDLFSLGTLLFHLVTGQLPFAGNNPSIVLRNIIEGNRPSVSDLAPTMACSLAELIHALLQSDPNYRPATARDVHDRLVAILAEVDLAPDDPEWSLQCWLVDPAGYADRLDERLRHVLLTRGKTRLEANDHLGALQLFNRLLTIDERHGRQNEEVLALVQGMHGAQDTPRRSSTSLYAGLGLLAAASLLTWSLWPAPPAQRPDADLSAPAAPTITPPSSTSLSAAAPPTGVSHRAPAAPAPAAPAPAAPAPAASGATKSATAPHPLLSPVPDGTPKPVITKIPIASKPNSRRAAAPRSRPVADSVDAGQDGIKGSVSTDETPGTAGTTQDQPQQPGYVTVHVPNSWGHIYIDGSYKGRTGALRDPIQVTPGTHILTVKNDLALTHEERFTIAPGETRNIETPELQRRPATVSIVESVDPSCSIRMDDTLLGTVETIGHSLDIASPSRRHILIMSCPEGTTQHQIGPLQPGEMVQIH